MGIRESLSLGSGALVWRQSSGLRVKALLCLPQDDICMHLTNYAINKHNENFVRDDTTGSKRYLPAGTLVLPAGAVPPSLRGHVLWGIPSVQWLQGSGLHLALV